MAAAPHARRTRTVVAAVLLVAAAWALAGCRTVPGERVANLHAVDRHLHRSAQPTAAGFRDLYGLGIRHVLDLRQSHDDRPLLGDLPLEVHRLPINAFAMTREQVVEAVAFLVQADGPVLVHCRHGSDRTGTVVAGYRIAAHGWCKERAASELRRGGFGFHAFFFPNLPKLILSLDEEAFRKDVRQRARQGFVE